MPTWSTQLPPEGKHKGFSLKRTPVAGTIQAIVTCEQLLVCDTHYWHGRTTPCERTVNDEGRTIDDSKCQACREKTAWRTHVYLSAYAPKTSDHFIFECTAHAAKAFAEYAQAATTLRGCAFHASRPKATPNSPVVIIPNAINLARVNLPNPPDVIQALAVIWRLPKTALPTQPETIDGMPHCEAAAKRAPHVRPRPDRLHSMRNQPDNMPDPPTIGEIIGSNGEELTKVKT